tara:strand:- start:584 stop:757 length:174 start_codon:yes stop_codon:yes gene_type:complete
MDESKVKENIIKLNAPYSKDRTDASITGDIDAIKVLTLIAINIAFIEESIKGVEGIF